MPEIRQNLATREWVIISTERAKRPEQFILPSHSQLLERPEHDPRCPFCPGNEELDLERLRLPAEGDWQLRVVRNRYPALNERDNLQRRFQGVNRALSGFGHHDVVIESRRHNTCPALEPVDGLVRTLMAFQSCGAIYRRDPRVEHIIFFKNHGATAGTSLVHPHSQAVALPVVPHDIRVRTEEARRYFDDFGECVLCRMRDDEERQQERVIVSSRHFTAFVPYAAYSPFHLWIVPRRHAAQFLYATADEVDDLARILRDVLRRIYFGLNDPDYNYVIRSAPESERVARHLHWYLTIIPRVTQSAGFEMGTGMFINTALPEESARFLREVALPDELTANDGH
ncbi:MAG: DUF4921 family protein [Chloroflexi bacterium]|nr:DUF4921 family protein [Chloroflexota bacterium]